MARITVQEKKIQSSRSLKNILWLYHVFIKKNVMFLDIYWAEVLYLYSSLKMIKIVYIVSHYFLSYNISLCVKLWPFHGVTEKRHDFGVSGQKAIFLSFLVGSSTQSWRWVPRIFKLAVPIPKASLLPLPSIIFLSVLWPPLKNVQGTFQEVLWYFSDLNFVRLDDIKYSAGV